MKDLVWNKGGQMPVIDDNDTDHRIQPVYATINQISTLAGPNKLFL
ncbi:MAG: hypothetical protein M3Y53_00290 [Thermoproteota archaeon]|nr:hypothetical protein [Thermoproteota archaeon]